MAAKLAQDAASLARAAAKQMADEFEKAGESVKQQVTGMESIPAGGKPTAQQTPQGQQTQQQPQPDAAVIKAQSTRRLQQLENEIVEIRLKREQEYQARLQEQAQAEQLKAEEEAAKNAAPAGPIGKLTQGITSRVDQMKKSTEMGKRPTG